MTAENDDTLPGQQYETINDPVKIRGLIERIQASRSLISIRIPSVSGTFNSMILEIDPGSRWIMLDELHPEEGHTQFVNQRKLSVYSEFDGVDIRFDSTLLEVGMQSKIHFYKIHLPETLKYFQRRSAYRVRVLRAAEIPVIIMVADGEYAKGALYNISAGGLGVKFTRNIPKAIASGQLIPECEIRFPDGEKFVCALEARHLMSIRNNDHALLGARFLKLNTVQQRTINRFIASLERESRRKAT